MPAYKEFEHYLRIIHKSKVESVYHILKAASNRVVKSIVEIAYNILKGDIAIKPIYIKRLKKDKQLIKELISKQSSLSEKRKLIESNPQLVKTMLSVVLN